MQQPEDEKVSVELTKDELDIVLRQRIQRKTNETARENFRNMSIDEQRKTLRNLGVSLL